MKLTEKLHPIDEVRLKHAPIFEGVAPESDEFVKALSRWAKEFPAEAAAYEESIAAGRTYPMEILDYWDEIELFAKEHPGMDIAEVVDKWVAAHPEKLKEPKTEVGKTDLPIEDKPEREGI